MSTESSDDLPMSSDGKEAANSVAPATASTSGKLLLYVILAFSALSMVISLLTVAQTKKILDANEATRMQIQKDIAAMGGSITAIGQAIPTMTEDLRKVATEITTAQTAASVANRQALDDLAKSTEKMTTTIVGQIQPILSAMGTAMVERLEATEKIAKDSGDAAAVAVSSGAVKIGEQTKQIAAITEELKGAGARIKDLREAVLAAMNRQPAASGKADAPAIDLSATTDAIRQLQGQVEALGKKLDLIASRMNRGF